MDFSVFLSHFWYIAGTFMLGLLVGWKTYPQFLKILRNFKRKE